MKQQRSNLLDAVVGGRGGWAGLTASLLLAACSGDAVDLGDGRLGGDVYVPPGAPTDDPIVDDEALDVDRDAIAAFAGEWQGYIEAYEFPSGADAVRFTIDREGVGKLTLGEGTPPAPPISAAEPFDLGPGIFQPYPDSRMGFFNYPEADRFPWEGFAYDVKLLAVTAERIRLFVDLNEIFAPGCALQAPLALSRVVENGAQYGCLPDEGDDYITSEGCFIGGQLQGLSIARAGNPITCSQQMLCREVCACDAQSCAPRKDVDYRFTFDAGMRDAGTRLEGSLAQGVDPLSTVRLTRVAAP